MMSSARLRALAWCVGCAGLLSLAGGAAADDGDSTRPRVRSSHAYLRAMIDEAARRSATFRGLVEAIEMTDGIVYVEHGECQHRVPACLTMSITSTAEFRFLRIQVDARQPDWEVMASIGHELRHAIEVLRETGIRSTESIFLFYFREGGPARDTFETAAAIRAGNSVKNEVVSFSKRR